ncbi:MAG: hypothetical protein LIP09_10270 [Bacteroidales bacterium]|nr:hypothetical protein [Bacteroidales bacterium]
MKKYLHFLMTAMLVFTCAGFLSACGDDDDDLAQTYTFSAGFSTAVGSLTEMAEVEDYFNTNLGPELGVTMTNGIFKLTDTYANCETRILAALSALCPAIPDKGWEGYYVYQVTCTTTGEVIAYLEIQQSDDNGVPQPSGKSGGGIEF